MNLFPSLSMLPWTPMEPHWHSMGFPEISRATLTLCFRVFNVQKIVWEEIEIIIYSIEDGEPGAIIRHKSEGWGFESPSCQDIFCLKNFDTFTKTSVRVSKTNVVAHAQLTFQMLTLLKKYLYRQSQCSKTWDSKCLALIAHTVRAFSMNPKIGGSSLPQIETFSVSRTLTDSQEHPFVCRKWMLVARAQLTSQMLTLL